ncbi:MAG: imidazolonepropionase [Bacteroidota bacterium]
MATLIKNISSLVTINANGKPFKCGEEMSDIGEIQNGAIIFHEKILFVGTTDDALRFIFNNNIQIQHTIDALGKTVLPGFVDSHTHFVFAGNRSSEFARRLRGVTYQQIAKEGGGILTTMKATREASLNQLVENGMKLANSALQHGTTTVEIKSGYGLSLDSEIRQLEAIAVLKKTAHQNIVSTFLGAHDFPPEYANNRDAYVDLICNEMLPLVAQKNLASFCDAFVDEGYYTTEQGRKIFQRAKELGLKIKAHADELANVAAAELAAELGAISADHLLFISDSGIDALKNAGTVATLLPGTAYFTRLPYAPARKLIESGAIVALATDCNPGSCFTENMQMILSLAVINMKMTAEEALTAATLNAAAALCLSSQVGSLEIGKQADLLIADVSSYTDLFYHFGINHIQSVFVNGKKVV